MAGYRGYLLDTNMLSEFAKAKEPNAHVSQWVREQPENALYLSVITIGELLRGIESLPPGKRRNELLTWFEELEVAFERRIIEISGLLSKLGRAFQRTMPKAGKPLDLPIA